MKLQTESEKLDELSMEETDEKSGASGRENGTEPLKPWMMALIFLGLAVTAAVICVIIWRFTHSDKPEGSGSLPSSEMAQKVRRVLQRDRSRVLRTKGRMVRNRETPRV